MLVSSLLPSIPHIWICWSWLKKREFLLRTFWIDYESDMEAASAFNLLPSVALRDGVLSSAQVIVIEVSQEAVSSLDEQLDTDQLVDGNNENQQPKYDEEGHEAEHSELSSTPCTYAASVSNLLPSVALRDGILSSQQVIVIEVSQEAACSLDEQLDTDHSVDGNNETQEPKDDDEGHEAEHLELSSTPCTYAILEAHGDGTTTSDDQIVAAGTDYITDAVNNQLTRMYAANSVLDLEMGLNGAQGNPGAAVGNSKGRITLHASGNHNTSENLDLEKGSNGTQERQTAVLVSEKGKAGAHKQMGRASGYVDKVCRVCHLGVDIQLGNGAVIELGCACKNDLAVAHRSCAEAWFKIKGNRTCEICGSTVRNVAGIGDTAFMENWNDRNASTAAAEDTRCWQSHRLFNFLLACMVFAFVIPWLFHVTTIFSLP